MRHPPGYRWEVKRETKRPPQGMGVCPGKRGVIRLSQGRHKARPHDSRHAGAPGLPCQTCIKHIYFSQLSKRCDCHGRTGRRLGRNARPFEHGRRRVPATCDDVANAPPCSGWAFSQRQKWPLQNDHRLPLA
jgi:hypothetical protein